VNPASGGASDWGDLGGTITDQTDLIAYLAATYLALGGGTMTGRVDFKAGSSTSASFRIPGGAAPSSPGHGDVYASGGTNLLIYLSSAWYFTSFINKPETFTAKKTFNPSVVGGALINLGGNTGVAPSSPVDGDLWQTSTGLYWRDNTVTEGPLKSEMKGASVALAGTIALGAGSHIHITTGTGPITDIDWTSAVDGRHCMLIFDVVATMAHSANLVLPGGVSHDFAPDEKCFVWQDSGDKVYVYPLKARKPKFSGTFGGAPGASAVVFAFLANEALSFPTSMAGSVIKAKTAATAQADFDLQKNGVSVGTVRFTAAGTVASYVSIAGFAMSSGDHLELVAPGSPDATLSDLFFTIEATGQVF
jgi:hypothetical protein